MQQKKKSFCGRRIFDGRVLFTLYIQKQKMAAMEAESKVVEDIMVILFCLRDLRQVKNPDQKTKSEIAAMEKRLSTIRSKYPDDVEDCVRMEREYEGDYMVVDEVDDDDEDLM